MTVVDLFAGPGGWDLAARALGIDPIGLELDDAACATRRAAGLRTMQCDVATVDLRVGWVETGVVGLIASPPCQAFSMAGKGEGRRDIEAIEQVARSLAEGRDNRSEAAHALTEAPPDGALFGFEIGDGRSLLVVEPLRWALALRPRWIACEQVAPVLPLWELFADLLGTVGYSTWAGVLSAEQYGVPQTRKRAILLASLDGAVTAPAPTHTAYAKGKPRSAGGLLPWVSMAEALGWGMTERPSVMVLAKPDETGGHRRLGGGTGSERAIAAERDRGAWHPEDVVGFPRRNDRDDEGDYRGRDLRTASEPAFALTEKARSWSRWPFERPATTIACDPRVQPPGHKLNADDVAAGREYDGRAGTNAVRIAVEEAAVLQSFPGDYPWQGTRSAQFTQVGNAIPPPLALAVLQEVLAASGESEAAA